MDKVHNKEYFCKSHLVERGWTEHAIKKWLGEPDLEKRNPYYSSAPPMKLYKVDRVLEIEESDEWQEWYKKSQERRKKLSAAQKERIRRQKQQLIDYINSLDIKIPKYSLPHLFRLAVEHYNTLWVDIRDRIEKYIDPNSINSLDKSFLARIAVNMLRHEFSSYEYEISKLYGQIGRLDGYVLLKKRVLKEIAKIYEDEPLIRDEANRQKNLL